jgi:ribosome biogenesis GTPase / thiamine phosphate phosphatase
MKTLYDLGYDDKYYSPEDAATYPQDWVPARVLTRGGDSYLVHDGSQAIPAERSGKLTYSAGSALDLPAVGDWVLVQIAGPGLAIIHQILPRRSLLQRKTPGKKVDRQLIAANIDTAFIVQALGRDFNLRRLERYLVMVHQGGIQPLVLFSKRDLLTRNALEEHLEAARRVLPTVAMDSFSNMTVEGMAHLRAYLKPGRTYCLLGSSGIGKTSLLNRLLGSENRAVAAIREKDGKGRHTTTARELIQLPGGALVIDTPGMRELGHIGAADGIQAAFDEIDALGEICRFSNCSHTVEAGCAVIAALESGAIQPERYENYLKLRRETAHNEASYLEKRRREKKFGKMVKAVIKQKRHRG